MNSLPRRRPASSMALVVRSISPLPASLMNRSRKSSRWNRKKITKSNTIPVVVNGVTNGCSTEPVCRTPRGGWCTSTGIGFAGLVDGVRAGGGLFSTWGFSSSLPRLVSRPDAFFRRLDVLTTSRRW